ncbi:MAG: NAD(P)-dependent oxidoreductase, partial [Patescibacteria group bacterium]
RGIKVANVPAYGENTVAEYTFGLILALTRKIYSGFDQIRETGSFQLDGLRGSDLKDKTLGVIGTGRIGKNVIRIANGFLMKVLAHDSFPDQSAATTLGFRYDTLEAVLAESDIVTLHLPQTKDNFHLINEKQLNLLKKTAYLINTARGGLVDTAALVRALTSGQIAGAALDVLEEEGVTKDEISFLTTGGHPKETDLRAVLANHVLFDRPNVIVTPHNAFNTTEALSRIMKTTLENIRCFLEDRPQNIVA